MAAGISAHPCAGLMALYVCERTLRDDLWYAASHVSRPCSRRRGSGSIETVRNPCTRVAPTAARALEVTSSVVQIRAHLHRRQRGGSQGGLRTLRSHLALPHNTVLADGRARRRLGRGRGAEPLRPGPRHRRDAVRGGRRRGSSRRPPEGHAGDHLHGLAGPAADGPQHVQDRRRAAARGDPRGRAQRGDPRPLHLRRPLRRDGGALRRLGDALVGDRPGGSRPRPGGARRDPHLAGAVPPLLRRLPHLARAGLGDSAGARGDDRHDRHQGDRGDPAAGNEPRSPRRARDRPEPRRLLPGSRGEHPLLP